MDNRGYPIVRGGKLSDSQRGMEEFSELGRIGISPGYQFLAVLACMLSFAFQISFLTGIGIGKGYQALLFALPSLAISIAIFVLLTKHLSGILQVRQSMSDIKLFDAKSTEQHIGIAYCDYIWAFKGDTSWDRGFIRYEEGLLCFRGFGPIFRLPPSAIEEIWIAVPKSGLVRLPRVYVRWRHPNGGKNVFSFEMRKAINRDQCFRACKDLVGWLSDLPKIGTFDVDKLVWPFESSKLEFARDPAKQVINSKDIQAGWGAAATTFVICWTVASAIKYFLKIESSFVITIGAIMAMYSFQEAILKRVIAKGNRPASTSQPISA